jgi:integrase
MNRLTMKKVAALRRRPGRYGDGQNLVLQVISATNASWLFAYERNGRARMMGLGPLHTISLKEARERARAARQLLLDGIDPLEHKRAERDRRALEAAKNVSFETCAQQYVTAHESKWQNAKHHRQFMSTMRDYVFPTMGALPVAMIDETLVLKCIRPIWTIKTVTASRVRNRIEAVLDYATAAKLRKGDNPARWTGNLEYLLPAPDKIARPEHHEALPYREIAAFMTALRAIPGVAARALEFTILCAARTGEVVGAQWDEIDLKAKTWTIPATRMKSGREHRVPLSPRALAVLEEVFTEDGNPFVFVGVRPGTAIGDLAMLRVLRRLNPTATVHGMRSTFRDWAAEQTAFANHVVEMALAHAISSAVEAAYRRGDLFDKRRKLMEAWGKFCSTPLQASAVVPLRGQQ